MSEKPASGWQPNRSAGFCHTDVNNDHQKTKLLISKIGDVKANAANMVNSQSNLEKCICFGHSPVTVEMSRNHQN